MNIKARIIARKIVFCYFFEQYFFTLSGKKTALLEEVEKIAQHMHDPETPNIVLAEKMDANYYSASDEEVAYIIKRFFENQWKEEEIKVDPDREYIKLIAPLFWKYEPIVRDLVNTYTVSFKFDEMDVLDRVIFVLGYVEWKEMWTPREVMINEMVEFGKRYGDESSSKLLNGIAHKLLSDDGKWWSTWKSPIDRVVIN
jgi:transcription termination factor NusB